MFRQLILSNDNADHGERAAGRGGSKVVQCIQKRIAVLIQWITGTSVLILFEPGIRIVIKVVCVLPHLPAYPEAFVNFKGCFPGQRVAGVLAAWPCFTACAYCQFRLSTS